MKLVNAGLGRTGTTSLQLALERLGHGPCYHMFQVISDERRLIQWERFACDGEIPDWADVFDGYAAAVDGPPAVYYQTLLDAFPDARVVLTVRDAQEWYASTYATLYQFAVASRENPPPPTSRPGRLYRLTSAMVWDGLFGGRFEDAEYAIDVYRRRNQEIIDRVEPGRLLVYDVREGWAPLCAFLGTPVPDEEFPRANDGDAMRETIGRVSGGAAPLPPQ